MASAGYIVIAEDDKNLRTLYHDVLTTHGYEVGAAAGGAEDEDAVGLLELL